MPRKNNVFEKQRTNNNDTNSSSNAMADETRYGNQSNHNNNSSVMEPKRSQAFGNEADDNNNNNFHAMMAEMIEGEQSNPFSIRSNNNNNNNNSNVEWVISIEDNNNNNNNSNVIEEVRAQSSFSNFFNNRVNVSFRNEGNSNNNNNSNVMDLVEPEQSHPLSNEGNINAISSAPQRGPRGNRELRSLQYGGEQSVLSDGAKRARVGTAKAPFHVKAPVYDRAKSTYLGGNRVEVTLGISALNATDNTGESATHNRPGIIKVLHQDENETWIAGHLLNALYGGVGETRNLTPLTSAANSAHEEWETRLGASLTVLRQTLERQGRLDLKDTVGFKYVVEVSNDMKEIEVLRNGKRMKKNIPAGLSGSIQLVNRDNTKISDNELKGLFRQQSTSPFIDPLTLPFHDPVIEQRGLQKIFNMEEQPFEAKN